MCTGPCPAIKFPTAVTRLQQSHIQPALLFFRTSQITRSDPRTLHEYRIIPPLCYTVAVEALKSLQSSTTSITIHFADEEADAYAVELAGRLGGYVLGNDSDFVVLNTEGYRGYIPLQDMTWLSASSIMTAAVLEDGFRPAKGKKKKVENIVRDTTSRGNGLIPPENTSNLELSFTVYTPAALAAFLKLPVSLLPLIGAIVGNDFTQNASQTNTTILFNKHSTSAERINLVASTIQSLLSANLAENKRQKHRVDGVMDLIKKSVITLLSKTPLSVASGEVDALVERIVLSALQYAIPKSEEPPPELWSNDICPLHEPDVCPGLPMFSRLATAEALASEEESPALFLRAKLRGLYLEAYRKGRLSPHTVDCLSTGTYWPRLFLENPDVLSVSHMTREIRQLGYAILDDAVGLPDTDSEPADDTPKDASDVSDDEDELVDVVEEDSEEEADRGDLLAPLRGALDRLHGSDNESNIQSSDTLEDSSVSRMSILDLRPRWVTEYVRRGARISPERVEFPLLIDQIGEWTDGSMQPLLLSSVEERQNVFFRALYSDYDIIRELPKPLIIPLLCIRWIIRSVHLRAVETESRHHEHDRWTRDEVKAFLLVLSPDQGSRADIPQPDVQNRNVQLTAQILEVLQAVEHLAEILLLIERFPSSAHLFSGKRFHQYLTQPQPILDDALAPNLMEACEIGLEEAFGSKKPVRTKKKKAAGPPQPKAPNAAAVKRIGGSGGLFDMLQEDVKL
jgi:hypothetical protein